MSYNGWKNWETWNVALWLGNDEGLYRSVMSKTKLDAKAARERVEELLPNGTPDFKDKRSYDKVDWDAIADDINEMSGV